MDDPRFLIDECLAKALLRSAQLYGYQAEHVTDLGFRQATDAVVAAEALRRGAAVVTANARDFRRIYAQFGAHPGLVVLAGAPNRGEAVRRFEGFLAALPGIGSLAGRAAMLPRDGNPFVFDWPPAA